MDQYELLVFEWKKKYLSVVPPAKLMASQIKKIQRLNAAISHFSQFDVIANGDAISIDNRIGLMRYLNKYQTELTSLKLKISSAENGFNLVEYN